MRDSVKDNQGLTTLPLPLGLWITRKASIAGVDKTEANGRGCG